MEHRGNKDVLYVTSSIPHWAVNKALFFIDLKNQTSFLYWTIDDRGNDVRAKEYGQISFNDNIANFIKEKQQRDSNYLDPDILRLLKLLNEKYNNKGDNPQKDVVSESKSDDDSVATSVEIQPQFKGGNEAFAKFLSDNIRYPSEAKIKKTEGRVWISFIIDENGAVTKAQVLRGIGDGCDEEALRVVKLSPNWEPAQTHNRRVKFKITIPISFSN